MRARELHVAASSSRLEVVKRTTTDGVDIYVATIDGGPTTQVCFTYHPFFIFFCIGENVMFFVGGGIDGK